MAKVMILHRIRRYVHSPNSSKPIYPSNYGYYPPFLQCTVFNGLAVLDRFKQAETKDTLAQSVIDAALEHNAEAINEVGMVVIADFSLSLLFFQRPQKKCL